MAAKKIRRGGKTYKSKAAYRRYEAYKHIHIPKCRKGRKGKK